MNELSAWHSYTCPGSEDATCGTVLDVRIHDSTAGKPGRVDCPACSNPMDYQSSTSQNTVPCECGGAGHRLNNGRRVWWARCDVARLQTLVSRLRELVRWGRMFAGMHSPDCESRDGGACHCAHASFRRQCQKLLDETEAWGEDR